MNHPTLEQWNTFYKTHDEKILDELLADEVVFYSPVVWTPQKGKWITKMYLMAAVQVFLEGGDGFKYIRKVVNDRHIILEFETVIDGITINGVDMMVLDDLGKIQEFKVMVRPLKAVNKIHEKMMEMLEKLKG